MRSPLLLCLTLLLPGIWGWGCWTAFHRLWPGAVRAPQPPPAGGSRAIDYEI